MKGSAPILAVLLPASTIAQADATRVVGRVVGPDGREPIAGVTVRMNDLTALTDKRGSFTILPAPTGKQLVRFEMLGYQPRSDSISVAAGQTTEILVRLSQKPIALPPVVATVRSRWLERNGHYDRQTGGLSGKYVTAADIEKRSPTRLTDVFQGMPGIKVQRNTRGLNLVRMNHSATDGLPVLSQVRRPPGCEPGLWIDGARRQDKQIIEPPDWVYLTDWDVLSPLTIEAIEVYAGAATPINFQHPCGVILVWTKRH